jgi:TP53 regulating kinase-like protein
MEFVEGERLKDAVASAPAGELAAIFEEFGLDVARLHSAGIMHGDLTTANVVRRNGELVFIDFGLAVHTTRVEDHAVDLRLIKETLVGAHPQVSTAALEALFRAAIFEEFGLDVARQLQSIERRGRYTRVA